MKTIVLLIALWSGSVAAQTGDAVRLQAPPKWEFSAAVKLPAGRPLKSSRAGAYMETASTSWQSIGPERVQSGYYSYVSGRVSSLAVDPSDTTTVYCATAGGGLWKTTDAGSSWTPLTDNLARLSSGSVAVDPSNANNIYYGTGELNFNLDGYPGSGVYKSTDAGNSWTLLSFPSTIYYTGKIEVAPNDANVVYVAGYPGIFKSTDAGTSWTNLNLSHGAVDDIVVDPSGADTIYAAYGSAFAVDSTDYGIFKSTNGGVSWTKLTNGLPPSSQVTRVSLAISTSDPNFLYAGINGTNPSNTASDTNRAYRSTDGGTTWSLLPSVSSSTDFGGSQGWYDNLVAVDPADPNIVYLGGIDLWKSTDGGQTWSNLTNAYGTYTGKNIHPDQHAFAFAGSYGQAFYIGNDGGVWKTTGGGSSFTNCNTNLSTLQFYGIDADQMTAANTVGGTQDNGTEKGIEPSTDWTEIYSGDGGFTKIDPRNSNTIYGEYVNGALVKSTDGGSSFHSITTGIGEAGYWTTPYVLDPVDSGRLFTATYKSYWSNNAGSSWSPLNTYFHSTSALVTTMTISPPERSTLYAGISGYRGASGTARLYLTQDTASSWIDQTANLPTGCDFCQVTADPTQAGVAYLAVLSGAAHVLKTTDYGSTWNGLTSTSNGFDDIPTKVVCVDSVTHYIYAGTYWGVYLSTDEGSSWSKFSDGLPNAVVDDISIQYSSRELRVGTHGRGIWALPLSDVPLAVQITPPTATQSSGGVRLTWRTQSEINIAGFEILRTNSRTDEYQIVDSYTGDTSLRGLGTSTSGRQYNYTDAKVKFGDSYKYKIEAISPNGIIVSSRLISVDYEIPRDFSLEQNYPNPFNPTTTIGYEVPVPSKIIISVYDVLGREVALLYDGEQNAGVHKVSFDGSKLASGLYFYRLRAEGSEGTRFDSVRKLMLVK